MSEFQIEVEGGSSVRLPTAGKYCPKDVVITAKPNGQIPEGYHDVSKVTAGASGVMEGDKFVDKNGNLVTGTMPIHSGVDVSLDTTIIQHYLNPGFYEDYRISIYPEEKTVTPTSEQQIIIPSQGKVLSKVIVNPNPSLTTETWVFTLEDGSTVTKKVTIDD